MDKTQLCSMARRVSIIAKSYVSRPAERLKILVTGPLCGSSELHYPEHAAYDLNKDQKYFESPDCSSFFIHVNIGYP